MQILSLVLSPLLRGGIYSIGLLPLSILHLFSRIGSFIIFRVLGYRKHVVIQNISRSFPQKHYDEVMAIATQFYHDFADIFFETIKLCSISQKEMNRMVEYRNMELLEKYRKEGKHVVAAMGHLGNWEAVVNLPGMVKADVFCAYKPLKTPWIDNLMRYIRTRFGMKLVPSVQIVRHILRNRKNPSIYLLIGDQCPRKKENSCSLSFLNQKTSVFTGIEKLGRKLDSAVVYFSIKRIARGKYVVDCLPITDSAAKCEENFIIRQYSSLLEKDIQEHPSQWLWSHKRWKR